MNPRILVLGSSHGREVESHEWHELPKNLNVADYDVVILNLVSLREPGVAAKTHDSEFPSLDLFARQMFSHESELIAIGSPEPIESQNASGQRLIREVTWWMPAIPEFEFQHGTSMESRSDEFSYYFEHVNEYEWFVGERIVWSVPDTWVQAVVSRKANAIRTQLQAIVSARFGHPVAFEITYEVGFTTEDDWPARHRKSQWHPVKQSGRVIWLPAATEVDHGKAVEILLSNRFGVSIAAALPSWISKYETPFAREATSEHSSLQDAADELHRKVIAAAELVEKENRYQRLLYEQGTRLERIVHEALEMLGAAVHPPKDAGKEDGRLDAPDKKQYMLEIKGVKKSCSMDHIRQLNHWVTDAVAEETIEYKGLLVINAFCEVDPIKRDDPFPQNIRETAVLFKQCLLTTYSLYNAIVQQQQGKFDANEFWNAIASTDGVFEWS